MYVCLHLCVSGRTIRFDGVGADLQPRFFLSYTLSLDAHLSLLIMQMVWGSEVKDPQNRLFNNLDNIARRTDYRKLATVSLVSQEKTKDCESQRTMV